MTDALATVAVAIAVQRGRFRSTALITPRQDLFRDLKFDSLSIVGLALSLEERRPGLHVSDEDIAHWQTVADVIATVEKT